MLRLTVPFVVITSVLVCIFYLRFWQTAVSTLRRLYWVVAVCYRGQAGILFILMWHAACGTSSRSAQKMVHRSVRRRITCLAFAFHLLATSAASAAYSLSLIQDPAIAFLCR